jgi:phage FluMu protein Com
VVNRAILLSYLYDSSKHALFFGSSLFVAINPKYLREYRCPSCHKLLAKGTMYDDNSVLEVKCRGCHTVCIFHGEDAEIIKKRAQLIKEGKLFVEDP